MYTEIKTGTHQESMKEEDFKQMWGKNPYLLIILKRIRREQVRFKEEQE